MTTYLFLDVDGVLNSTRSALGTGGLPQPLSFNSQHPLRDGDFQYFDWIAVRLIARLVNKEIPDVKVILSSDWRIGMTDEVKAVYQREWGFQIHDKTPYNPMLKQTRGEEVEEWLSNNPEPQSIIIIDDRTDFGPELTPHLIQTNPDEGFSYTNFHFIRTNLHKFELKLNV